MKKRSMKQKITIMTTILVIIGFVILVATSLIVTKKKVTNAMIQQFINENTQIADEASYILEKGGTVQDLQTFVESKVKNSDYFAYAVVIDKNVTAIAHSDTEKIGKSYADDTAYTVPAATEGKIMNSQFWADVQKAWTYDVMCPIKVNGEQYGSMDVGIFNSEVDNVVSYVRNIQIVAAVIITILICVLISLVCGFELKPFGELVALCARMGTGDFTVEPDAKMLARKDEVGRMANALREMEQSLAGLIASTSDHSHVILDISKKLNQSAEETQEKAATIVEYSQIAVSGSEQQTELTHSNAIMTEEISKGMEDIANNIMTVTTTSGETAEKAMDGSKKLDVVVNQMSVIEKEVSDINVQILQLEKMSSDISNVVKFISSIASQTNMLALNAAIEAARAGEQGKGFAVVASQVGTLADQSKEAAEDISKIIMEIQGCIEGCVAMMEKGNESVKQGMSLASEAKESFEGIKGNINMVSDEMMNVSAVTEEATSGTVTLYESIERISKIADSVSSNTKDVSSAADAQDVMMKEVINEVNNLSSIAKTLQESLEVFKI